MNKRKGLLILGSMLILLSPSYYSCKGDDDAEVITVIEKDTVITVIRDTIVNTDTLVSFIRDTTTTFILVRHAEKSSSGSDPVLTAAGLLRADHLRDLLKQVDLNAVYSTNFNRTRQTAQPTATDKGLSIINYDPFSLSPFVDSVLANFNHGTVLVVGHSNTTPSLLNELVGSNTYANIPDSEYDNLYIVSVAEKGRSEVLHLKY